MKQIRLIAANEWQYWCRSHLVLSAVALFLGLVIATSVMTTLRILDNNHEREHQQIEAETTFKAQPDRHPHRMVHYGHYVFRTAAPLSVFDPGLDAIAGQSIFLEGHRQNTAMFAESGASANMAGFSWLSPAWVYQLFAPLLILLLGHNAITRERESAVLTPLLSMGVKGCTLLAGKTLAFVTFGAVLLIPLAMNSAIAWWLGESLTAVCLLVGLYAVYLSIWIGITLCVATVLRNSTTVLAVLTTIWITLTLVLPSAAVSLVSVMTPTSGKIKTDLAMLNDLRALGDGHNANDPAFNTLRNALLKQYNVTKVEDLPINFRGMVAAESEKKLTQLLNKYAAKRQQTQQKQTQHLVQFGWLTPTMAVAFASRAVSATDLHHYHRFENEAETLRYGFVQGLNRAHQHNLSYQDDINRNKDEASWQRAKVDANHWQLLNRYQFSAASIAERVSHAVTALTVLALWLVGVMTLLMVCARRIQP